MKKKRKSREQAHQLPREPKPKSIFASPFKNLGKLLEGRPPRLEAVKPLIPVPIVEDAPDEELVLSEAMQGVRPLSAKRPSRMPLQPVINRNVVSEDAEVLARLSDLISGQGHFDITETDEYVEGTRTGMDPRLLVRLRRGEFATQAHIDLHGMTQDAARQALPEFIMESVRKGLRAVLVVHGRGLGSPGGRPILKHAATQWLSRGSLSGYVLAFTTARAPDGGAGAMYVLLRRDRRRGPFEVLNGAKRHE